MAGSCLMCVVQVCQITTRATALSRGKVKVEAYAGTKHVSHWLFVHVIKTHFSQGKASVTSRLPLLTFLRVPQVPSFQLTYKGR